MTKAIHLINGDASKARVVITVQEKVVRYDSLGNELHITPVQWTNRDTFQLDNPGNVLTIYIHPGQRFIVEEYADA